MNIREYSVDGINELVKKWNIPPFRARQLIQWLYQKGVRSYDDMTNLPKALRDRLKEEAPLYPADIVDSQDSRDGTRKYILRFHDGAEVEMVAMPTDSRLTVCVSSQIGCAMGCSFCATGKEGLKRNLLPGEMAEQVCIAQRDMGMRASNVVIMGQGEPFQNYEATISALRIMNGSDGMNIGARHMTVSTCGLLDGIRRFGKEPEQFTLAISLHSAVQDTRDRLMPRMRNQPIVELREAVRDYQRSSGRRVTFEYLLIKGVNEDDAHMKALCEFCRGISCHVNFIPLNEVSESPYRPAPKSRANRCIEILAHAGVEATLRDSRGGDIAGACGQLKNMRL